MRWFAAGFLATLLCLGERGGLCGEARALRVGDVAPKLETGKWLRGEPVAGFEKGKTYLIEFWATWCEPCRAVMPLLTGMQKKYAAEGLVVIAQDVWEEDLSLIEPFLKNLPPEVSLRMVQDDVPKGGQGKMASWLSAARERDLPCVFIIDRNGIIAWIDRPVRLTDTVLKQILSGSYDLATASTHQEETRANETRFETALQKLNQEIQNRKWEAASATLARAREAGGETGRDTLMMAEYQILMGKADYLGAYKVAAKISENYKDNALLLNEVAWQIASDSTSGEGGLALAENMADRANEVAKGKNPGILDTLARIKFRRGKRVESVELEKQAVAVAQGSLRERLDKVRVSYEHGILPRVD